MPRRRSKSSLEIRWTGAIVLGGPSHLEHAARAELADLLFDGSSDDPSIEWDGFSECFYLTDSGRSRHYAEQIASEVRYQAKGRKIVVAVRTLDVMYRNGRGPWKWWARVRNGKQTIEPGDIA
jgi:hypothetical protein